MSQDPKERSEPGKALRIALESLEPDDWKEILARLLLYANSLAKVTNRGSLDAKGPEDFAQSAIIKFLEQDRRWMPAIEVFKDRKTIKRALFYFLAGAVRSEMSNAAKRESRRFAIHELDNFLGLSKPLQKDTFDYDHFLDIASTVMDNDEISQNVLKCILSGIDQAKDIATVLDVPRDAVYKSFKRLRRRLSESQEVLNFLKSG